MAAKKKNFMAGVPRKGALPTNPKQWANVDRVFSPQDQDVIAARADKAASKSARQRALDASVEDMPLSQRRSPAGKAKRVAAFQSFSSGFLRPEYAKAARDSMAARSKKKGGK